VNSAVHRTVIAALSVLLLLGCPPGLASRAQALSSDAKLFAYSVTDGTVHIATLPEGWPSVAAIGFAGLVDGLAFSADGKELASVAHDGSVRIVACADGRVVHEFACVPAVCPTDWRLRTIEFVDDGTKLLVANGTPTARLLNRTDGKVIREFGLGPVGTPAETATITAKAISRDLRHFALGDRSGRFAVCSGTTGEIETGPIQGPTTVYSLDFDPTAERLAVGAGDCNARVYSLKAESKPQLFSHLDGDIFGDLAIGSVRFSPDGKSLLTTQFGSWEVRLWDLQRGNRIWSYDFGEGSPAPIVAQFTGSTGLVVTSPMGTVLVASNGLKIRTLDDSMGSACYHVAGDYVWGVSEHKITLIEPRTAKPVCEFLLESGK
jgi:WD40 repeat protein